MEGKLSFTMGGGGGGGGGGRDGMRSGMYVHPERLMVRKAISCNGYYFINSAERMLGCECLRMCLISNRKGYCVAGLWGNCINVGQITWTSLFCSMHFNSVPFAYSLCTCPSEGS